MIIIRVETLLGLWLVLWCLTYFSYMVAVGFIGGGNLKYPEKTTDLPQVTDNLYWVLWFPPPIKLTAMI